MTELENEVTRLKKENEKLQERSKSPITSRKSGQLILKSPELTDVDEEPESVLSSYILKEIKDILLNPDEESFKCYKEMVKEANEWMKENDLKFEYKLILNKEKNDKRTLASVQITDIKNTNEATWTVARLKTWLDASKMNQLSTNDPFNLFDITWKSCNEVFSTKSDQEPSTPSKIFSRLNEIRNSLTKSPLQHLKSVFSPTEPKSRRCLIEDKENQTNVTETTFTSSAKKILLDVASSNIKLKRLCRPKSTLLEDSNNQKENEESQDGSKIHTMKSQLLKNSEKIENIVHQMNLILTENTIKDNYAKSPSKAVKFLID